MPLFFHTPAHPAMALSPPRWLLIPAIFLAATLLYLPSITGGFFFDDILNIVDEGSVKVPDLSLPYLLEAAFPLDLRSGIRPLSRLSFALNYYVSGMNPAAFKLVNMVLHGLNAVLVFLFLHRLLGIYQTNRPQPGQPSPLLLAAIAALLWAAAPIHANTVPYVVQRMVILCGTFSLLSLIAYLQLRLAIASRQRWAALGWCSLAGMSSLFALMSKEIAILIPVYILVMEATLLHSVRPGEPPTRARRITALLALLVVLLPVVALAVRVATNPDWLTGVFSQRSFDASERMMTESRVIVMYLSNVVLPRLGQIHFYYDNLPISHSLLSPPTTLASMIFIASLIVTALIVRLRWPLFAFAVLWFLGGHMLEGTFVPLELVFWHRNYLPSLGPLVLVAWGLAFLLTHRGDYHRVGYVLAALVAIVFTGQTLVLAYTWGSPFVMAFAEHQANPTSPRANYEYARQSFAMYESTKERHYLDQTAQLFARAVDLDPDNLLALYGLLKLKIAYGYEYATDPYAEIIKTLRTAPPRIANDPPMNYIAALGREHPDRLTIAEVLALYDALDQNPLISAGEKAQWLVVRAYFLTESGFPVAQALDLLREARRRAPDNFHVRIKLLEGLVASGNLSEADTLLRTGFSPWERPLSTTFAYAARLIRDGVNK